MRGRVRGWVERERRSDECGVREEKDEPIGLIIVSALPAWTIDRAHIRHSSQTMSTLIRPSLSLAMLSTS